MMKGGVMYNLDVVKLNCSLIKSIKILVATKRMIGKGEEGYSALQDIERELRDAVGECQRVIIAMNADAYRPLIC